jgi:type IV secretory pathway component VirB8
MKKLQGLTPLRPLSKLGQSKDNVEGTIIKNKMVTREQYDKVESSLANKQTAWKWATDKLDDAQDDLRASEKMTKVAWIVVAVLATLSALQSIAIFWMLLS